MAFPLNRKPPYPAFYRNSRRQVAASQRFLDPAVGMVADGRLDAAKGDGMGEIVTLDRVEGVRLDPDRMGTLRARMGCRAADAAIARARCELSLRLDILGQRGCDPRGLDLAETAESVQRIAGCARQVGLTSVARVAADVAACARAGDGPALAATLARLLRIGARSLDAMMDLRDSTG